MSHFYASIQGSKGEATRAGGKSSGIDGHVRGWQGGVKVVGRHDDGIDTFIVYATGGSAGYWSVEVGRLIDGVWTANDTAHAFTLGLAD